MKIVYYGVEAYAGPQIEVLLRKRWDDAGGLFLERYDRRLGMWVGDPLAQVYDGSADAAELSTAKAEALLRQWDAA